MLHFAGLTNVGESVRQPERYHEHNVGRTKKLLEAMLTEGVKRLVFSSTCATYGVPERMPMTEDLPQVPINPYGQTKLEVERILRQLAVSEDLSFAAFRYFNAAGAAEEAKARARDRESGRRRRRRIGRLWLSFPPAESPVGRQSHLLHRVMTTSCTTKDANRSLERERRVIHLLSAI